jgi:hypothetical protein
MKLEVFEDRMYFDQWCVRPEGSKEFGDTIHFVRQIDALLAQKIIERWIEQEREACAQVVEEYPHWIGLTAKAEISNAIRARGER